MRVGRYEVIAHLATGGMAQIYLARQSGLGQFERHVVLKTILRERASDQRFVTMFLDEAKLAATLNHQNVAQVYEVDQADGAYFMAMEYVHGENARALLETTLRRGWTIPLELATMIISGAAAGLHHAHERRGKNGQPLNIVHRDVSPANIMVGYDGSIKVLDFGIAKAEERATKTVGGTIKGKYGYMSPEQCKGKSIDRRSDIFALGIVLYELTTLRRAFKGNDDFETMKRIVSGDVVLPSVAVPNYPRELEAIVLTAMANDPGARFQTAQEMIEALDAFQVRAKLTGSNTAMGRFMVQLFGAKKEPWVGAPPTPEQTQITIEEGTDGGEEFGEGDNDEKTLLVENRDAFLALAQEKPAEHRDELLELAPLDPMAPVGPPIPKATPQRISSQKVAPPRITAAPPVQLPQESDAAAWQNNDVSSSKRTSARMGAVRPNVPFADTARPTPPPHASQQPTPIAITFIGQPQPQPPAQQQPQPQQYPQPPPYQSQPPPYQSQPLPYQSQPPPYGQPQPFSMPQPFAGPAPLPYGQHMQQQQPMPMPQQPMQQQPMMMHQPMLHEVEQHDELSVHGAVPLLDDPKLGWTTNNVAAEPLPVTRPGAGTRLDSVPGTSGNDYRIRSNGKWIILAIFLVLAAGFAVAAAVLWS